MLGSRRNACAAARVASAMGAADVLLAEAFLRLEGVGRELVKTLHTVKAAPSGFLYTPNLEGPQTLRTAPPCRSQGSDFGTSAHAECEFFGIAKMGGSLPPRLGAPPRASMPRTSVRDTPDCDAFVARRWFALSRFLPGRLLLPAGQAAGNTEPTLGTIRDQWTSCAVWRASDGLPPERCLRVPAAPQWRRVWSRSDPWS
jgi:hypothetical protein